MELRLRPLTEADMEQTMRWRMDPDITRYMNTDPVLTLEGQMQWLARIRRDPGVRYWMIVVDGEEAGVINLADIDLARRESGWGYYVGEKRLRSLKLSLTLEWNLYDYVFETMGLERLHNEVLSVNEGVIKLHLLCGSSIDAVYPARVEKNGIRYDVTAISITSRAWAEKKKTVTYDRAVFVPEAPGEMPEPARRPQES